MLDFSDFHACWLQHVSSFDVAWVVLLGAVSLWALASIVYTDFEKMFEIRRHESLGLKLLWAAVVLLGDLLGAVAYLFWKHYYAPKIGAKQKHNDEDLNVGA